MALAPWAYQLAGSLLAEPLPRRWAHTCGVHSRAKALASVLGEDGPLLQAAALLHDIGYSPRLVDTGFHPLDGARFLRNVERADERVVRLVAHHSCALLEAEERGLRVELEAEDQINGRATAAAQPLAAGEFTQIPAYLRERLYPQNNKKTRNRRFPLAIL